MSRRALLISTVLTEGALLLIAVVIMWWADLWPTLEVRPIHLVLGAIVGAGSSWIAIRLAHSTWKPFRRIRQDFDLFIGLFAGSPTIDLVIVSVLAGVCEEALFRGLLQTWAATWTNPHLAVVLAAVVFGLTHAISRPYVVFVTVLGLMLGYLYHFTGSLAAVMLAHALYDLIALYWGTRTLHPQDPVTESP
ncbi:MAG: CPBP family intramembrane metalloprotease [Actinomycetota bacterium]|nr:CPBP family intramembrane metalloprotease [Actinomycetota bacterium]